jgi:hypothetical protein
MGLLCEQNFCLVIVPAFGLVCCMAPHALPPNRTSLRGNRAAGLPTCGRELNTWQPQPSDSETCGKLQTAFASVDKTNHLEQALIGERALMIPAFRLSWAEIRSFSQSEDSGSQPRKSQPYSGKPALVVWITGFFERDLNFYLQTMDKAISLSKLPLPENLLLTNHFEEASQIARKNFYPLSGMLLPAFSRVIMREAALKHKSDWPKQQWLWNDFEMFAGDCQKT